MAFRIPTPMLTALTLTITLAVASLLGSEPGVGQASDLAALAQQPLDESEAFRPVSQSALDVAAARLRSAIVPLQNLLTRSPSGANWKIYLDWPGLTLQAASAKNADLPTLKRLEQLLLSEENGLEMHQFVAVRRALSAYAEAVEAAKAPQAQALYKTRMQKLSAAVAAGATAGTTEALAAIGPLLARWSNRVRHRLRLPRCAVLSTNPISIWTSTRACSALPSTAPSIRPLPSMMSYWAPVSVAQGTQRGLCCSISCRPQIGQ